MDRNEISFENRPKAVAHLRSEVAEIKTLVEKGQTPAVFITGKYTLADKRVNGRFGFADELASLFNSYRNTFRGNGKKLYFFEDELLEWIAKGKKKTMQEIESEVEATYDKRRKR